MTELGRIRKKGVPKAPDFKTKKAASPESKIISPRFTLAKRWSTVNRSGRFEIWNLKSQIQNRERRFLVYLPIPIKFSDRQQQQTHTIAYCTAKRTIGFLAFFFFFRRGRRSMEQVILLAFHTVLDRDLGSCLCRLLCGRFGGVAD